jgi:transcriptional regulator with XRE-family HTH domain
MQVSGEFLHFSPESLTLAPKFSSLPHMSKRATLGGAVKAIREAKALTNPIYRGSNFAIACGMSHAHLCNIEAGRKQPPEAVTARIALALGVSIDAISYPVPTAMEAAS